MAACLYNVWQILVVYWCHPSGAAVDGAAVLTHQRATAGQLVTVAVCVTCKRMITRPAVEVIISLILLLRCGRPPNLALSYSLYSDRSISTGQAITYLETSPHTAL